MPTKGFFTGLAALLTDRPIPIDAIHRALHDENVLGIRKSDQPGWFGAAESLVLDYRPQANGKVVVDAFDQPWPDAMGDPKTDTTLFAAWSMGAMGPFTFPGNLERAAQQSWHWEGAAQAVSRHRGFIRVRSSYVLGATGEAKVLPRDYEPIAELMFLSRVAHKLMNVPGVLCYFNPNGETLHSVETFDQAMQQQAESDIWPTGIWCNVRLFNVSDEWVLMDTVGMGQVDLPEMEACFHRDRMNANEVAAFLRNLAQYLIDSGPVIKDGNTSDSASRVRWRCREYEDSLAPPPRSVMRWLPEDGTEPPIELRTAPRKE
jgi:hypothetical protein